MKNILLLTERDKSIKNIELLDKIVELVDKKRFDYVVVGLIYEWEYDHICSNLAVRLNKWKEDSNCNTTIIFFAPDISHAEKLPNITYISLNMGTPSLFTILHNRLKQEHTFDKLIFKNANGNKIFSCLNRDCKKIHRIKTLDQLAKHNMLNQGTVSAVIHDKVNFEYFDPECVPKTDLDCFKLKNVPDEYLEGFVDIVTETSGGPVTYFSEKVARPIYTLKPFLIVGPPGINHKLCEEYGFKLYDRVFDYSFDKLENLDDRILYIIKQVKWLSQVINTVERRQKLYSEIFDICVHNYNVALKFENYIPKNSEQLLEIISNDKNTHFHFIDQSSINIIEEILNKLGINKDVRKFQSTTHCINHKQK